MTSIQLPPMLSADFTRTNDWHEYPGLGTVTLRFGNTQVFSWDVNELGDNYLFVDTEQYALEALEEFVAYKLGELFKDENA